MTLMISIVFFCLLKFVIDFFFFLGGLQQAETQIKRRIGIGNHISERRLIDDLTRMGMNDSIVSV